MKKKKLNMVSEQAMLGIVVVKKLTYPYPCPLFCILGLFMFFASTLQSPQSPYGLQWTPLDSGLQWTLPKMCV